MKVARHFSAGKNPRKPARPVGTRERIPEAVFSRPYVGLCGTLGTRKRPGGPLDISRWRKPPVMAQKTKRAPKGRRKSVHFSRDFNRPVRGSLFLDANTGGLRHRLISWVPSGPILGLLFVTLSFFFLPSSLSAAPPDGKIHISYWEKWSGEEQLAMQETVDAFNHSQNRIVVDFLSVGQIEEKTLLATAGGDPPDVSGVYLVDVCAFADRNALTPLTPFIRADGLTPDQFTSRYARAFADMGTYRGEIWSVPSTPTTTALYWNKDAFRAAGLDPEQPPRTTGELVAMSQKLTRRDAEGNLTQVGFLPQLQAWWVWAFPLWFGGQIFDGTNITIGTNPTNVKTFAWLGDFTRTYGLENVRHLSSTFGSLATPDDPFMSGKVAMMMDGVWRYNYIQQFAPGLNYGVAPMPAAIPGINDFTLAESDMLVIPRGARHPREAWEFLKYISSANLNAQTLDELTGAERVCFLQKKASPLAQWSPYFATHHPNPYIGIFRQLDDSPHAVSAPKMGIWNEYQGAISLAFDKVRLNLATPQQALDACQQRIDQSWQWHQQSIALHKDDAPLTVNPPPATP